MFDSIATAAYAPLSKFPPERLAEVVRRMDEFIETNSPDEKTRAAGEGCEQKLERFDTALLQNERLYSRIKATSPRGAAAIKMRKDILDAFEDTGVALPTAKRARMSAILERLEAIRQEFGRNIRNNKTRLVFSADDVRGLPQDYLDRAPRDDKGNLLLGFEYPEYLPFMANAENEVARRRYQFAYSNRGTPRNIELLSYQAAPGLDFAALSKHP